MWNRINIDELLPSQEIQKAVDKQLTADRERIAAIAKAEAESIRLTNEAQNNALMATAKAQAEATKTQADADRYRIETIQKRLQNTDQKYFQDLSINAYEKLAKSQTNLVVVPNEHSDQFGQTAILAQAIRQIQITSVEKPLHHILYQLQNNKRLIPFSM